MENFLLIKIDPIGYDDIAKFGEYIDDPHSLCMEKRLVELVLREA